MTAPVVHHGDCIEVMRGMADNSVDAIVTDPPYGLGFMGKAWDDLPPGEPWARECLRILKPGGHLLAFGGTRTWHRLACAIEDAGFEIRDSIAWLYGSGFPKSLDVSKAVDRLDAADERRVRNLMFTAWMRSTGIHSRQINDITGTNMGNHYLTEKEQPAVATADLFDLLRPYLPNVPADIEELVRLRTVESEAFKSREKVGAGFRIDRHDGAAPYGGGNERGHYDITAPATDAARQWQGWGTALKPAFEPVVMARKPLVGTVAGNVITHGTGALNIDATRIGAGQDYYDKCSSVVGLGSNKDGATYGAFTQPRADSSAPAGRWPANVALDEDQAAALDQMSGNRPSNGGAAFGAGGYGGTAGANRDDRREIGYGDTGGASRFFYVAKAPAKERPKIDGIAHPTVKPLALMRWLIRLVTPPGGTVLDPFAGSGTTIEAAMLEGFNVVGIEREADYLPLIQARIDRNTYEQPDERYGIDSFTLFDTEGETA